MTDFENKQINNFILSLRLMHEFAMSTQCIHMPEIRLIFRTSMDLAYFEMSLKRNLPLEYRNGLTHEDKSFEIFGIKIKLSEKVEKGKFEIIEIY